MALFRRRHNLAPGVELSAPDPHRTGSIDDSGAIIARLNRTFRRRLSDRVEDVFWEACLSGDLDSAAELLSVMENMSMRRQEKFGQDRRVDDQWIVKAQNELARRKAAVTDSVEPRDEAP